VGYTVSSHPVPSTTIVYVDTWPHVIWETRAVLAVVAVRAETGERATAPNCCGATRCRAQGEHPCVGIALGTAATALGMTTFAPGGIMVSPISAFPEVVNRKSRTTKPVTGVYAASAEAAGG